MRQFPASPITALIDDRPRYNLGESCGRDLSVAEILTAGELADFGRVTAGYGTSTGDADLRAQIAARHGVRAGQVLITAGAASALFLMGLLFGDGEIGVEHIQRLLREVAHMQAGAEPNATGIRSAGPGNHLDV